MRGRNNIDERRPASPDTRPVEDRNMVDRDEEVINMAFNVILENTINGEEGKFRTSR